MHVVQVLFTSNTSQKCQTFLLKYSGVGFSVHVILIGTIMPRKFFCQDIEPSFYEFNTYTNRRREIVVE